MSYCCSFYNTHCSLAHKWILSMNCNSTCTDYSEPWFVSWCIIILLNIGNSRKYCLNYPKTLEEWNKPFIQQIHVVKPYNAKVNGYICVSSFQIHSWIILCSISLLNINNLLLQFRTAQCRVVWTTGSCVWRQCPGTWRPVWHPIKVWERLDVRGSSKSRFVRFYSNFRKNKLVTKNCQNVENDPCVTLTVPCVHYRTAYFLPKQIHPLLFLYIVRKWNDNSDEKGHLCAAFRCLLYLSAAFKSIWICISD